MVPLTAELAALEYLKKKKKNNNIWCCDKNNRADHLCSFLGATKSSFAFGWFCTSLPLLLFKILFVVVWDTIVYFANTGLLHVCENKGADHLCSAFVFATRIVQFLLYFPNPEYPATSHIL